jgi:glycosyltransferase 2 family protein
VRAFFHAVEVFFGHLAAVGWAALAIALLLHFLKVGLRTVAWRNILAAAYPDRRVRWSGVFGAYVAGVGINSIAPARGGDLVKLFLVKRTIPDSSYATLAPTLIVETVFDFFVASILLIWAAAIGVLPSGKVIRRLPSVDWSWPFRHPTATLMIVSVLIAAGFVLLLLARRRVEEFRARVAQGFTILQDRPRFVRQVVLWQAASWGLRIASVYWFLRAFHIDATLYNSMLVQVVESLATVIPITPGGAGTKQGLIVYVFRGDVSTTALLSFSVGMNIALVAFNVAIGLVAIAVMAKTLDWRRLARTAQADAKARP